MASLGSHEIIRKWLVEAAMKLLGNGELSMWLGWHCGGEPMVRCACDCIFTVAVSLQGSGELQVHC
jgi:hypothetical protein